MSFARHTQLETNRKDKLLGLASFIALAFLIAFASGKHPFEEIFNPKIKITTVASQTYGVSNGALIKLAGITVGRVDQVRLINAETVQFDLVFDHEYQSYLTSESYMVINTKIGLDTVIAGTGLTLVSLPSQDGALLQSGSRVRLEEPKSLDTLLDEWNVESLTQQINSILSNLASFSDTINQNENRIKDAIVSSQQAARSIAAVSGALEQTLPKFDAGLDQIESTMQQAEISISQLEQQLAPITKSIDRVSIALSTLAEDTQPAVKEVEPTLVEIQFAVSEASALLRKLQSHWLFGRDDEQVTPSADDLKYMGRDDLYFNIQESKLKPDAKEP